MPSVASAQDACPAFRWTTLGTAGGPVPTPERSEPANLLDAGGMAILVDTGDGTADALAQIGRQQGEVSTVVISHLHWDHVGGLAAVLGLRWMNTFPGEVRVYGPPGTQAVVDGIIASLRPQQRVGFGTGAAVADPAANIRVTELTGGETVDLGEGLRMRAARNSHFDQSIEEVGTVSLSLRFDMGGRSITYTGDSGPITELTALAEGSDMLLSEVIALEPLIAEILATRPDMPAQVQAAMRQHLSTHHIDAGEVGRLAAEAGVGRLVLTHFAVPPGLLSESERYLRDGVRQHYSGPLDLARDLASYDVGCD
ncbi:MBL fold metallo-hydrolase [Erythrobacter arachoides]|uniref:MBL fold metallo-hydrolase n=1 Tax=Aurantiacibacter arachoides TaxID=1850444 RepID=A0A844ZYS9_9SPHN|nr:MBL fold metallo-hydrolase [Aurantiacibacter arachoides]MXO92614.1 MBL fold metallo-hydrolase [Aurantiacibacter arachoides]